VLPRTPSGEGEAHAHTSEAGVGGPEDDPPCIVCGVAEAGPGKMRFLLCDGPGPMHGKHVKCAGLEQVPAGDWFCSEACREARRKEAAEREPPPPTPPPEGVRRSKRQLRRRQQETPGEQPTGGAAREPPAREAAVKPDADTGSDGKLLRAEAVPWAPQLRGSESGQQAEAALRVPRPRQLWPRPRQV
jgi:hypothetical protein